MRNINVSPAGREKMLGKQMSRRCSIVGCLVMAVFTCCDVRASTIFESGDFTGLNPGLGAQGVSANQYMGWRFTLPSETLITSFGGTLFLTVAGGTFFGAIASVADLSSFPGTPLTFSPIVTAVLSPPLHYTAGSLTTASVSANLPAGSYALIFGSGRFGASGVGGIANIASTPPPGNAMLVGNATADVWGNFRNGNYYFVSGNPIPEPQTGSLIVVGLACGVFLRPKSRGGNPLETCLPNTEHSRVDTVFPVTSQQPGSPTPILA
jgi:hypothetical protein